MILEKLVYNTISRETTIYYVCNVCGDEGGRAVIPSMANPRVGGDQEHHLVVSRWGRRSCRNNLLNRCYNNFCLYEDNANPKINIESFSFFNHGGEKLCKKPQEDNNNMATAVTATTKLEIHVRCKHCGCINAHELRGGVIIGEEDPDTVSVVFTKLGMRCCDNCHSQYSLK